MVIPFSHGGLDYRLRALTKQRCQTMPICSSSFGTFHVGQCPVGWQSLSCTHLLLGPRLQQISSRQPVRLSW